MDGQERALRAGDLLLDGSGDDRSGYFTVPSCDGAIAKVRELGGNALAGPFNIGAGWISVVRDPQGAAFALFEGETDA